jgi:tellurite resistance-related uncharacterized protein
MSQFNQPNVADQPPAKLIAQGLSLVKMENDSQQMMALQVPRKEKKIYEDALTELELNPEHAAKSYYSIPHEDRRNGKTVFVEGPGIKAAMSLARRWGNCANSGRVVDEQDDFFLVQGVFLDYETNFRSLRDVMVQKKWKSKEGKVGLLSVERMQNALQAGISKAVRNAILASLPVGLVDAYFKKAKELAVNGGAQAKKPIAERLKDAKAKFKKIGVPEDVMEKYIAAQIADNDGAWKDDDVLAHLIGVWNAIEDNQATIEEVFTIEAQPSVVMPAAKSPPATPPSTTNTPKDKLL